MEKSSNVTIETNTIIDVTREYFRFGQSCYENKSIIGLRIVNIDPDIQISWIKILFIFILGIIIIRTSSFYPSIQQIMIILGLLSIIIGVFGSITNLLYPKKYGLEVTFNSGDKFLFINDKDSLRFIVDNLHTVMKAEKEEKANKTFINNIILNDSNFTGNMLQHSEIGENVSFTSNDDNSQGIRKS